MPKIKCNVIDCFDNKDGICFCKEEIELMKNEDNNYSLECLNCSTQEEVKLFQKLKGMFRSEI